MYLNYKKIFLSLTLVLLLSSCTKLSDTYITNNETCDISKLDQSELIIQGDFMKPIFKDGDNIKYIKDYYKLCNSTPELGDIIIYNKKIKNKENKENKESLIPRIIKINSKSTIEFKGTNIMLDGKILKNSEGKSYKITKPVITELSNNIINKHIPNDSYLIFEDNIYMSDDSRKFGIIEKSEILGKVITN